MYIHISGDNDRSMMPIYQVILDIFHISPYECHPTIALS
jgi:hypothetical protein